MHTLIDRLSAINSARQPIIGRGAVIRNRNGLYLRGKPDLWTAFRERAFLFRSLHQAEKVIAAFKLPAQAEPEDS